MNIAVILAGGLGKRFGEDIPKQFLFVAGEPLLLHTCRVFESHPLIDTLLVVSQAEDIQAVKKMLGSCLKLMDVIEGGEDRLHSTMAAVKYLEGKDADILIHDGARPMVSEKIINRCLEALKHHDAVGVGIPVSDTLYEIKDGKIISIPDRTHFWRAQTPQCFKLSLIEEACRQVYEGFVVTDDISLVSFFCKGVPIYLVEGSPENIKITYKKDIVFFENYLANKEVLID